MGLTDDPSGLSRGSSFWRGQLYCLLLYDLHLFFIHTTAMHLELVQSTGDLFHVFCGRCNCWGSNSTPFFQTVKLIAAIFRAKVRRAIVGRIPFSTRAT